VGELNLVLLHMLRELASRSTPCCVTLLPMSALEAALQQDLKSPVAAPALSSSPAAAAVARRRVQPLHFMPGGTTATRSVTVSLRFASSWSELPSSAHSFYCPSLMWFGHLASLDGVHSALTSLLQPLGAPLYPPLSWDSLIERKDKIYAIFHAYMLPTTWVAAEGKSISALTAELLRGKPDGRYRIKGACSCCGKCGATIDIKGDACPALQAEATRFVLESHQPSIGIQPFIDSFPSSELRFWTVADSTASAAGHLRFRSTNILLKTSADLHHANSDGIPFKAEVYAAVHDDSLACSKLIDRMQHEQAAFFEHIYELGVRCLRFDMGFDAATKTAFFNEFASAPDGNSWSEVHQQDLLWLVGTQMINGMIHGRCGPV